MSIDKEKLKNAQKNSLENAMTDNLKTNLFPDIIRKSYMGSKN